MDQKKRKVEEENGVVKEDVVSEDEIAQLVELLSKEQLAGIVKQAALLHTDTLAELRKLTDEDPASRKLFVRGLSWTTSTDVLKSAFQKFGPVEFAVVVSDKSTGKSKGFGFVTFKHKDACIRALKEPSKEIEGRMTVCHLSGGAARDPAISTIAPLAPQVHSESVSSRKIYVGNIPKSTQGGTLLEFFSQYGEIEEGPLGFDRETGKCKGFALFIYKTSESARKCLEESVKKIGGHQVHCKLAEGNKGKDEGLPLSSSVLGYDITNPATIASYNPSFLHSTPQSLLQANHQSLLQANSQNILQANPQSLFQANSQTLGQSLLQPGALSSYGLYGLDPLGARGSALLGADATLGPSSAASLYGLPSSSHSSLLQGTRSLSSLASMPNAQGSGFPSLPRPSLF